MSTRINLIQITDEQRQVVREQICQGMSDKATDLMMNLTLMCAAINEYADMYKSLQANYLEGLENPASEGIRIYINGELCVEADIEHWNPADQNATQVAEDLLMHATNAYSQRYEK